jgi:hypothetical protein
MKIQILTACILLASLAGCNKKAVTPVTPVAPEPPKETVAAEKECYQFIKGKDTVSLTLAMNANNANGELSYNLDGKDKNTGTFSGIFIGDTLYSDYTFQSEGMTSVRETVFLRNGNTLIQGFGDMTEKDNKQIFKDGKKLKFDHSMVLTKMDCK